MLKMNEILKELGDMMRLGALAYLLHHKELLEDENYHCVHKMLMYAEARQYAKQSVDEAYNSAERAVKTFAKYMLPDEIESYKGNVEHLAHLMKKYDLTSRAKESDFFNY